MFASGFLLHLELAGQEEALSMSPPLLTFKKLNWNNTLLSEIDQGRELGGCLD